MSNSILIKNRIEAFLACVSSKFHSESNGIKEDWTMGLGLNSIKFTTQITVSSEIKVRITSTIYSPFLRDQNSFLIKQSNL